MVNVFLSNFVEQSNDLIAHLPMAAFVALDEEMTGITLPPTSGSTGGGGGRPTRDTPPSLQYPNHRSVAERYSIIQLGISLFEYTTEEGHDHDDDGGNNNNRDGGHINSNGGVPTRTGRWLVRRYNFYMFPSSSEQGRSGGSYATCRDVVLNTGAVAFLAQHNMNFDAWMKQGISYQTTEQVTKTIQDYRQRERHAHDKAMMMQGSVNSMQPSIQEVARRHVVLSRVEDIDFHARAMASLREWLDAAHPPAPSPNPTNGGGDGDNLTSGHNNNDNDASNSSNTTTTTTPPTTTPSLMVNNPGATFLLPPCNSFLRRALYESIEKQYPSLILESAGPSWPNQIRVWRLSDAEKEQRDIELRKAGLRQILHQVGLSRVFLALSRANRGLSLPKQSVLFASCYDDIDWDYREEEEEEETSPPQELRRRIPLVVHNGFMDLLFLLSHFHSPTLPESLHECKSLIRQYFPSIYDTKVLATECSTIWNNESTNLSTLFQNVVGTGTGTSADASPAGAAVAAIGAAAGTPPIHGNGLREQLVVVPSTTDGATADQEHEAAYDAYLTGAVYIGLCQHIKELHPSCHRRLRNPPITGATHVGSLTHLLWDTTVAGRHDDQGHDELVVAAPSVSNKKHKLLRSLYGWNKLYQMSVYTMDLEPDEAGPTSAADPLSRGMLPNATYRVSEIDPSVVTRDIVQCLNGIMDVNGRRVNFEIVWIDDTTFLVAASYRPVPGVAAPVAATPPPEDPEEGEIEEISAPINNADGPDGSTDGLAAAAAAEEEDGEEEEDDDDVREVEQEEKSTHAILYEHGLLILDALRTRFPKQRIVTLEEDLRVRTGVAEAAGVLPQSLTEEPFSWLSRLWSGIWGGPDRDAKRKTEADTIAGHEEGGSNSKRRRLH